MGDEIGEDFGRWRALERMAKIWVGTVFRSFKNRNPLSIDVGWYRTLSGGEGKEKRLAGWVSRPIGKVIYLGPFGGQEQNCLPICLCTKKDYPGPQGCLGANCRLPGRLRALGHQAAHPSPLFFPTAPSPTSPLETGLSTTP